MNHTLAQAAIAELDLGSPVQNSLRGSAGNTIDMLTYLVKMIIQVDIFWTSRVSKKFENI